MISFFSLSLAFAAIVTAAGSDNQLFNESSSIPSDATPQYIKLYKICESASSKTYVAVRYGENTYNTFEYGACYPTATEGKPGEMAVFCKPATCYGYLDLYCTGGPVPPVPILVPQYTSLTNVADITQLLKYSAVCSDPNEHYQRTITTEQADVEN